MKQNLDIEVQSIFEKKHGAIMAMHRHTYPKPAPTIPGGLKLSFNEEAIPHYTYLKPNKKGMAVTVNKHREREYEYTLNISFKECLERLNQNEQKIIIVGEKADGTPIAMFTDNIKSYEKEIPRIGKSHALNGVSLEAISQDLKEALIEVKEPLGSITYVALRQISGGEFTGPNQQEIVLWLNDGNQSRLTLEASEENLQLLRQVNIKITEYSEPTDSNKNEPLGLPGDCP